MRRIIKYMIYDMIYSFTGAMAVIFVLSIISNCIENHDVIYVVALPVPITSLIYCIETMYDVRNGKKL